MDYSYFINTHSAKRRPVLIRELAKMRYTVPNAISLAEGMPNDATFPFERITIQMKDGQIIDLKDKACNMALQYSPTQGYPPFVKTLKEFTQKVHNPPCWDNCDLLVTNGSQCGLSKSIEMIVESGDWVLVPDPVYAGTETIMAPFDVHLIGMDQDENGIIPHLLRCKLAEHEQKCRSNPSIRMPKLMYVNPTGANPNGVTIPTERRREIYKIACDYNILILEDDAYCFMHFLDERPESFLTLDTEGRVMRFDSFSKVLSSGVRIGFITGPKQLVHVIELHIQSSYLHSSTLSQVVINNLLISWGYDKLMEHFEFVRRFYEARRDFIIESMKKHLTGLAEWNVPTGGIFVWIKIPDVPDLFEMLTIRCFQKEVIFARGHAFMMDVKKPCQYLRACYSIASHNDIDTAISRLAELIREEKQLLQIKKLTNGK